MRIVLVGFGSVGRALAAMLPARADALYRAMGLAPKLVGVIDSRGAAVSEHDAFGQTPGAAWQIVDLSRR